MKTFATALILFVSFFVIIYLIYNTGIILSTEEIKTLKLLIYVCLGVIIYCIVSSELTGNYSQVDRLWSIVPLAYAWIIAWQDGFGIRALACAVLVSMWGIRLSANFALKGGYHWLPWKGEEDYRWEYLRKEPAFQKRINWFLFNVFFISFYQMGLILYFSLPMLLFLGPDAAAFGTLDIIAIGLFIFFLLVELIADIQQFRFQKEKYRLKAEGGELPDPYAKGFIDSGLWAIVRHPNYAAEQMIWFCVYLFGVAASGEWVNWTLGGFILLVLLFKGSSDFSERISASKYPKYKEYIARVPRFIPGLRFGKS